MTDQIIVADTGPLIAFARINHFHLLPALFGTVFIPKEVANESLEDISLPGAKEIQTLIDTKQLQVHEEVDTQNYFSLFDILDTGEINAIALAVQLNSRLLIDEKLGRGAAKKLGLKIIGTAGVLLLGKQKELIDAVSPLIDELQAAGYYFSSRLRAEVLRLAKEL